MRDLDWEKLYAESLRKAEEDAGPPSEFISRICHPTPEDLTWLRMALREKGSRGEHGREGRKWLVAHLAYRSPSLAPELFEPMMAAAVDEPDPSFVRCFVEPPIASFGVGRVQAYLVKVLESGTPFRKANAVHAQYWLGPVAFDGHELNSSYDPDVRERHLEELEIFSDRWCELLFENFVNVDDLHLRRCIVRELDLEVDHYSETFRPLVQRARDIALGSKDEFIRAFLDSGRTWSFPGLPPPEDPEDA